MLLAIDTATAIASVSLYQGTVLAETTWNAGRDHTRELLPRVGELLGLAGRTVDDIAAVGVSLGPGSFNGLRVGIATAKAISLARDIPIIGIETLRAMAYQFRVAARPVRPLYSAGLGEIATGLYQANDGLFATLEEPRLTTLDVALADSPADTLFCGELRPEWCEVIVARFGRQRSLPDPAENLRRAGYLAELAWQQWQAGIVGDAATLQPIYLRRPAISGKTGSFGSAR